LEHLSPEGFVVFKVDHFIDEHCEWLIREEEVLFLHAQEYLEIRIRSGTEVTGDRGSGIDSVDFVAVMSYEGVLSHEPLEGGGDGGLRMQLACATTTTCNATFLARPCLGDLLAQRASCGLGRWPPVFIIAALSVGPDSLGFGNGDSSGVRFSVEGTVNSM
jgi:hypothetical protein